MAELPALPGRGAAFGRMTDTPDPEWLAAVRRCGGKPRPGEGPTEFAQRVAREFGLTVKPREMPESGLPEDAADAERARLRRGLA